MYRTHSCAVCCLWMDQIIISIVITCAQWPWWPNQLTWKLLPTSWRIFTIHCCRMDSSLGNSWKLRFGIFLARLFWHCGTQQWSRFGMTANDRLVSSIDLYTHGLALMSKVYDINPRWLLCDKGEWRLFSFSIKLVRAFLCFETADILVVWLFFSRLIFSSWPFSVNILTRVLAMFSFGTLPKLSAFDDRFFIHDGLGTS